MIPKKLYIPTTTLNFNNIMASESISPAGFYSVRGFGYKRFDKVAPNCLDKRMLFYDKYPNFTVDDEELESYPLVIEVSSSDLNEDVIKGYNNDVFYSEETIYLNPFSTKIYFRSETEKRRTLSKVEQSLNTKMVSIYQNSILVKPAEVASFDWRNTDIVDSHDDFAKHISKDRRINKLKGFLYAYLLGANRSLSHEVVVLKKSAKELRNTISAILTNPDGYANYKQKEELDILYQKINNAFHYADGTDAIVQNLLKHKSEEYNCPNFIDILRKENLYDTWFQSQGFKPSYRVRPFNLSFSHKNYTKKNEYNSNDAEENQKYFDGYFTELDNAIGRYVKSTNTIINGLPVLQHCNRVSSIPADKTGFQAKLFNEYAEEHWNSEEFLISRLDFATAGGKLFKEELGNSWENSPSKSYINDLRKNLASHTPFKLNSVPNLTLQSFAVFCQKGEEDIDKLEDYLISNSIADFRIAFSLWGIVFGFANLPKTLTNELFLSDDNKYKSEIYKYIFKQVHGIELEGEFETRNKQGDITTLLKQDDKTFKNIKTESQKATTIQQQASEIEIEYRRKIKQIPKITNSQIDLVVEILKERQFVINDKLLDVISKIDKKFDKRTNLFKAIKKSLGYTEQDKSIQHKNQNSLFENMCEPIGRDFYKDRNIFYYIESMIPNDQREKVKAEIDWIQKAHCENGYKKKSGEWVKLEDHTNTAVIRHFKNNTKNKIEESLLKQIVLKLSKLYFIDEL
jgi:hypothetical protein